MYTNNNRPYILPVSPIYLVPSNTWPERWRKRSQRFPYLPQAEQAIGELCDLSIRGDGIPATVHQNSRNGELRVYGSDYYLGLYPTQRQDGYLLSYIEPLDLRAHEALANGVLLMKRARYLLLPQLPEIPDRSTNCWLEICQQWEALEQHKQWLRSDAQAQAQEVVTVHHKRFLNTLSSLIDITYQLEQEKYKSSSAISYKDFTSTDKQRSGLHDIYEFQLYEPLQIWQERYLLRIAEAPDLRGRIEALSGTRLTIKFEDYIDRKRIPRCGRFEILPNRRIFDVQRRAVKMYSEGTARNPHLLRILVDHIYQPRQKGSPVYADLNAEQLAAFQQALTVPDLLLVLGPPGTGKTHTITETIRHHCTVNKKRVLVTAGTHKAVDNVLSRLPEKLEVVRVGHENRVAEDTQHLLVDAKAKKMQAEILNQTKTRMGRLACFLDGAGEIMDWRNELEQLIGQIEHYQRQEQNIQQRKQQVIQRVSLVFEEDLLHAKTQLQIYEQQLNVLEKRRDKWQFIWTRASSRIHLPVIGWFFAWCVQRSEQGVLQAQNAYEEVQRVYEPARQAYNSLQDSVQRALWADAEYRMIADAQQQIGQSLSHLYQKASRIVGLLHGTVEHVPHVAEPPKDVDASVLRDYAAWYGQQYSLLLPQANLLRDWRRELEERTTQLRPELMRYADVIGATCIGVETVEGLEDLDFDLAIVDEAGQICLPDLLVPLARADRAVLVGDHQQLPPFVDNEVHDWLDSFAYQEEELGDGMDSASIAALLTHSAFELLFENAARYQRLVRLTRQFRMPQIIADFASEHFYNRQLSTEHPEKVLHARHDDPLFRSPLVVIDTTTIAAMGQGEQRMRATENWAGEGYINKAEAKLIAALALWYEQVNVQWVIIVPYRAQAHCIIDALQNKLSATVVRWEDRVSTVDSFQGSECDKVIYGFTRSNPRGEVGFLTELRRLNVAMTRAKEQLVIVGDFSTLTSATNQRFRSLARALHQHAQRHGEVLSYEQCQNRVATRKPKE